MSIFCLHNLICRAQFMARYIRINVINGSRARGSRYPRRMQSTLRAGAAENSVYTKFLAKNIYIIHTLFAACIYANPPWLSGFARPHHRARYIAAPSHMCAPIAHSNRTHIWFLARSCIRGLIRELFFFPRVMCVALAQVCWTTYIIRGTINTMQINTHKHNRADAFECGPSAERTTSFSSAPGGKTMMMMSHGSGVRNRARDSE